LRHLTGKKEFSNSYRVLCGFATSFDAASSVFQAAQSR